MGKVGIVYYKVPTKYWHRIHFVRPRFKGNMENILLYMAKECCRIPSSPCKEYKEKVFNAIRMFPGNLGMSDKTLHNWRTEIPALFGFYKEDKTKGTTETSSMAVFLHENQDITQFLRLFLLSFQFPGGHMKPDGIKELICKGIKFKPARTIIQVLLAANELSNSQIGISLEEATYCIFNDSRVTSGSVSPCMVAKVILHNRKQRLKYYNTKDPNSKSPMGSIRSKGDITRYAGDVLYYMKMANLLDKRHGLFYLKDREQSALEVFNKDNSWFSGYDELYGVKEISSAKLSSIETEWFGYVNESLKPDLFKTSIHTLMDTIRKTDYNFAETIKVILSSDSKTKKEIGDIGEALVYGHEKMRIKLTGYRRNDKTVKIVDSPGYHPGFDIDSWEADGTGCHRYIEVKTTISKDKVQQYGFHMSTNEWMVAETIREHYYVYRLMISGDDIKLFILRNPVGLYKMDKIYAEPRNGMDITFSETDFKQEELLIWTK